MSSKKSFSPLLTKPTSSIYHLTFTYNVPWWRMLALLAGSSFSFVLLMVLGSKWGWGRVYVCVKAAPMAGVCQPIIPPQKSKLKQTLFSCYACYAGYVVCRSQTGCLATPEINTAIILHVCVCFSILSYFSSRCWKIRCGWRWIEWDGFFFCRGVIRGV